MNNRSINRPTTCTYACLALSVVLLGACSPPAVDARGDGGLTFILLNDTYRIGAVESGEKGGLGRVVTVIREAQARGRDVHVLHAGDFLYPSLESQLWNGAQMIDALNYVNAVAPLYAIIGNHETDRRSPEYLVNAVRSSEFAWLGDNYRLSTRADDVDAALQEAFVLERDGKRIGVFALTLHEEHGGNERDYLPIDADYVGVARRVLETFAAANVDLVIGVTHQHVWQDQEVAALKEDFPRFLFIGGGHEHEAEYKQATPESAAVFKGASNARAIWQIDIAFDANGLPHIENSAMLELTSAIEPDPGYARLAARWRKQLLDKFPFLVARVGEAALPLDAREVTIRNVESNWANFVVDQMRNAFGDESADFAFINSGTLRIDDFVSGDITFEDIGRTFGFSSYLRTLSLTGAEFRTVLEAGFRGVGPSHGYFPQISGFRVCVDRDRPDGERIVSMQVPAAAGWQEIAAGNAYSLVVSDYVYGGGDGYRIPQDAPVSESGSELKYLVLDAVMAAQAQGRLVGAAVDPANPRIVILKRPTDRCFPKTTESPIVSKKQQGRSNSFTSAKI